jgi:predicted Zn-dependent protease
MLRTFKFGFYFMFFIFIIGFGYHSREPIRKNFFPVMNRVLVVLGVKDAYCAEPIPYVLGTFDTKFKISKSYFLDALKEAEMIWEEPYGKELFTYEEGNTDIDVLKINLVYDYRQEATSKLASLGIVVENTKASYDSLKVKFTALQKEYDLDRAAFEAKVSAFNERNQAYEKEVKYWNSKGGAPKNEYEKLEQERLALNTQSAELQKMQKNINETVNEINSIAVALNRLVGVLNLSVEKYNTVGASRGESFEEGVYSSEGFERQIDIYEFSNRTKLVRVLAHELGHALGLDHVEDSKAIMYKLNEGGKAELSVADLEALQKKCGVEQF